MAVAKKTAKAKVARGKKPAKQAAVAKKPIASKRSLKGETPARKIKQAEYKSFRLSKRIKPISGGLPSSWTIMKSSLKVLKQNWKLFFGIGLMYAIVSIVLVRGFSAQLGLADAKDQLLHGDTKVGTLTVVGGLLSFLIGTVGTTASAAGGVYQTILLIIGSIVIIWALRQVQGGVKVTAKHAYYRGTYSLVPFTIVMVIVGVQFLPMALGGWLYSQAIGNNISATFLERASWGVVLFLLGILSLYMVTSSLFALYISTLPDMEPFRALRSARKLVLHRRWMIMRKILFLPLFLLVATAIIMVPLLLFATTLAEWSFFVLGVALLIETHSYMYTLYRSLL